MVYRIYNIGERKVRGLKSKQTERGDTTNRKKGQKRQQEGRAAAFGFDFNCVDLS